MVSDLTEVDETSSTTSDVDRKARRSRWPSLVGSFLLLTMLIIAWHLATAVLELIHPIIIPPPLEVGKALIATLSEGFFYEHLMTTASEVIIGFVLGALLGFVLGSWLGTSRMARAVAYPYIIAFQGLPKVVLAPLVVTAFGFGISSKIFMAILMSFFPLLIDTMTGVMSVDVEASRLMVSLTATKRDEFLKLALPHSLRHVFAGLKTGMTLSLVGAIVGEFVGAFRGLGYLLNVFANQLQIDRVWAVTILLGALGVVLFLVIELVGRKLVYWHREERLSAGM
jgi:NitT/TauT family transport system permease protein